MEIKAGLAFIFGLLFGTGSAIMSKTLFIVKANGKPFRKPLFHTFFMFVAMISAFPIHFLVSLLTRKSKINGNYEALPDSDNTVTRSVFDIPGLTRKRFFMLAIPSAFDLVGTALGKMGLFYINVSIYQLMRCALILSVALVRRFYLNAVYPRHKILGILLNSLAVAIVASTSFFSTGVDNESSTIEKLFGIFLVLLSCFVQSIQYVFEETVMEAEDSLEGLPPLIVVGFEGFWGILLNIFFVLPVASILPGSDCHTVNGTEHCCYEDSTESIQMLLTSSSVQKAVIGYTIAVLGYNIFAVHVTYFLDSVWHAILDNFRPLSVWIAQLILFQLLNGKFGEKWTNVSFIQLIGLSVMLFGTAVYKGNVWKEKISVESNS